MNIGFSQHTFKFFSMICLFFHISCNHTKKLSYGLYDDTYLIYNAQIIDVTYGKILKDNAILITGENIKIIDEYSHLKDIVPLSKHIDVENKFLIPGLWDMHVHIEGEDLVEDNLALFQVYLAYGITTVRDMASDLGEQVLKWRDEINQGKLLGPQIFTAGRKLEGINSIWKGDLEIGNENDMLEMLDKLEAYNVDQIKITENTLGADLFLKSVQESRKRGFKVSGHVPIDLSIYDLADAGYSSIEHASYLLRLGSDEKKMVDLIKSGQLSSFKANEIYESNFDQDTAYKAYKMLAAKNVAVTPTLIGSKQLAFLDEDNHQNDKYLELVSDRFISKYTWRIQRMANDTEEQKSKRKNRYKLVARQLPYLQKSGVKILAGSDAAALNTYVYPALSLHEELVLFQKAGLTPLQILQSATIHGAQFMGVFDKKSTISVGKEADMVILNSNPLDDISATQDIHAVINDGQYFSRNQLDQKIISAKQIKITLDHNRKDSK